MSKKTFSVEDILWAFIENTGGVDGAVSVSMAGGHCGYVRIKGPNGQHQVIIERYNATVGLTEVHSGLPGVERRPQPPENIENHPLGCSSGPSMSPFLYGISAKGLRKNYTNLSDFVTAIVHECTKAGSVW